MTEPRVEPRVIEIAGRKVTVIDRTPPLPPSLRLLLEGGRSDDGKVWQPLRLSLRRNLDMRGARAACADQDHRLTEWLEGLHQGPDGLVRFLHLEACRDCGAVCVRDRSVDNLTRLSGDPSDLHLTSGAPLRRRNHVLGWYTGARPGQRVYYGPAR